MTELDDAATAVLTASRALLAVVARSVAPVLDEVTVPQFRVLVILSSAEEPLRHGDLADALGLHSSTFTRTADRRDVVSPAGEGADPQHQAEEADHGSVSRNNGMKETIRPPRPCPWSLQGPARPH